MITNRFENEIIQIVFESIHVNCYGRPFVLNLASNAVPGCLISYEDSILLLLPGVKKYPGCYAKLQLNKSGFEYSGSYCTVNFLRVA